MRVKLGILLLCGAVLFSGCRSKGTEVSKTKQETGKTITKEEVKTMAEPIKPAVKGPTKVKLQTSMGDIVIELDEQKAPITCINFLAYVKEGFYDGTVFHRVIPKFMIQGGGMTVDLAQKPTLASIKNESTNGLKNDRGTIAMARTDNPDSATSQFFINLVNNTFLDYASAAKPGYAVFGKVVEGMDIVDKIAAVQTTTKGMNQNVPVTPIIIQSAKIVP